MKQTQKQKGTTKSSSSKQTVPLQVSKGVLDLGRALVKELGLDPGVDTLGRWMAHYIAELIQNAETAKTEERPYKLSACADAILKLWDHRHQLPSGKRPFEEFEPILRTMESLDPTDNTPRYFRSQRRAAGEAEERSDAQKWLELADGVDYSAKILIRYCLAEAAQAAKDKSKKWVKLAEAAGRGEDFDLSVIRLINNEHDLLKDNEPDDQARRLLEDRIQRLESFFELADSFLSELRVRLKEFK